MHYDLYSILNSDLHIKIKKIWTLWTKIVDQYGHFGTMGGARTPLGYGPAMYQMDCSGNKSWDFTTQSMVLVSLLGLNKEKIIIPPDSLYD